MQHELAIRIAVLFTLGVGLSLLFNLLLMEHHVYTLTSKYPTYFGSVWYGRCAARTRWDPCAFNRAFVDCLSL